MTTEPFSPRASRPAEVRAATALIAIGAWTVVVPYLGEALGLVVKVPGIVEVVDHVIPGTIVMLCGLYLRRAAIRGPLGGARFALLAAGACFLAGFWVLVTHLPLVGDAADDQIGWDAAIWHAISALPIVGLALWCVLRATPTA